MIQIRTVYIHAKIRNPRYSNTDTMSTGRKEGSFVRWSDLSLHFKLKTRYYTYLGFIEWVVVLYVSVRPYGMCYSVIIDISQSLEVYINMELQYTHTVGYEMKGKARHGGLPCV